MFKISNLSVNVEKKEVLKNFNLEINDGEIHVLMGKNGIGKSSLCKVIMKDSNYTVLNGKILYNNKNLLDLQTHEVARENVMLISQNPISVEGITNAELLRCALREKTNQNVNIFEFNKEMEEICEKLNLDKSFIHKEINMGASGGERKKVELLHVGILKPSFLILDEIDSGLDVDAIKTVTRFINDYHKKSGCSILLITHHPSIFEYIKPNYVHILDDGKIIASGDKNLGKMIENYGFNGAIGVSND